MTARTRTRLASVAGSLALLAAPAAAQDPPAAEAARPAVALEAATTEAAPAPAARPAPDERYGFEITRPVVDRALIVPGGPGRDGVPAVDAPRFAGADAREAVSADTPVLGVALAGAARAYLLPVLEVHQVVNDELGGVPIAVTYDPLTGAARAFERRVDGRTLRFGVSGLIYNSGFLLYDRETESLWSQFEGRALAGRFAGRRLARVPAQQQDFASWMDRHPASGILIPPDPERVDYNVARYEAYAAQDDALFPVLGRDRRFHAKELTLGVVADGAARAYLASLVTKHGGRIEDEIAGQSIRVAYDPERGVFEWEAPPSLDVAEAYWFAWKAFHPDTEIWRDPGSVPDRER